MIIGHKPLTADNLEFQELLDNLTLYLNKYWDNDDPSHDVAHCQRVVKRAILFAANDGNNIDKKVIIIAGMFHDLVNLPKNSPQRHLASKMSADKAINVIGSNQFTKLNSEQTLNIHHSIVVHSYSAQKHNIMYQPVSHEAKYIQDSDRLDALGALGILRCFYVAGKMSLSNTEESHIYCLEDPKAENRELNDRKYALDHFHVKLYKIASNLKTSGAKQYANGLIKFMKSFEHDLVTAVNLIKGGKDIHNIEPRYSYTIDIAEAAFKAGQNNNLIYTKADLDNKESREYSLVYKLSELSKPETKIYMSKFLKQFRSEVTI